jgi:hypothetical protein
MLHSSVENGITTFTVFKDIGLLVRVFQDGYDLSRRAKLEIQMAKER